MLAKVLTLTTIARIPLQDNPANVSEPGSETDFLIEKVEPLLLADHFLDNNYRDEDGRLLLRRHRADFYRFDDSCYRPLTEEEIGAQIYQHLETCWTIQRDKWGVPVQDKQGRPKLRLIVPKRAMIREVLLALPSRDILLADRLDAPCWLNGSDDLDPTKLVPCRNGLLDLRTRKLHPLTPDLFSVHALPFDYDPDAPDPIAWRTFLSELWETDPQACQVLQTWFGYILGGSTKKHKILLLIGPPRSGKGTIGRILTAMLGSVNVVGATLGSMTTNFGLQAFLGKPLAIFSDARLSGRADQATVLEKLLSISGEDKVPVDRKHKPPLSVKLPTRLMLLTNELPRLTDPSGSMANRFVVLRLTRSFLNCEDDELTDKLLVELPSILNWALDGWDMLQQRGCFTTPASSGDVIRELQDLGSPTLAFVRDRCELGPKCSIAIKDLFQEWKDWCRENGRDYPGTTQTFGRDLRAAVPDLNDKRPSIDGKRSYWYQGIEIR